MGFSTNFQPGKKLLSSPDKNLRVILSSLIMTTIIRTAASGGNRYSVCHFVPFTFLRLCVRMDM